MGTGSLPVGVCYIEEVSIVLVFTIWALLAQAEKEDWSTNSSHPINKELLLREPGR